MKKRIFGMILVLGLLLNLIPGVFAAGDVTGTLEKRDGCDLATVRCELSDGSYFFADVTETDSGYSYRFARPDGAYTVRADYFSTTVWDGAVDISWYDAAQSEFYLDTPAKLAGLAALVNGQVDADTPDYRIKGNRDELVSTRVDDFLIIGAGGGNLRGTVYVADAAHDFSDKTVYLTADMDMGGVKNWTPIGGKYPLDAANSDRVIEAFFNGTLDGLGHRIINLYCDRYAAKGYAYSWAIGLIGFIGELYDGESAPKTAPAVRNLSVSGSVYGRRSVGGIVGKSGSIPTGISIENCANHASVKNTDSKGVGGIIGMSTGKGAIVNCYNTGSVSTTYACPAGGIIGSNGGLDIYNCYNVGTIDSSGNQRGRGIGGHDKGGYTVSDCYYLEGCDDDPASNGWYYGTALSNVISVAARSKAEMTAQAFVDVLNVNGAAYVSRPNAYPVLAWEAAQEQNACAVRTVQPEGGTVTTGVGASVSFGTVLHLSNVPTAGWAFRSYTLNGKALTGPYATITSDSEISAVYSRMVAGSLYIQSDPAFTIRVTKDGTILDGGVAQHVTDYPVADGDPLYEGDVLTAKAELVPNAEPDDLSYVYNGSFRYYFTFMDEAETQTSTDTGKFTVTSMISSVSLRLHAVAYTSHKVWTELAETDWYHEDADSFTLTTARQLAGLAALVKQGNSFVGKTVRLGADISLVNDDKTFNRSIRWFDGIGSIRAPFSGTFDGCGYRITEMTAVANGSGAALFLATDGAVLKNISVSGEVRANGSAAGIAAQAKNTQFIDCVNEAAVTASGEKAGGIAAQLDRACTLSGCINRAGINGTDSVGGLVGILTDTESSLSDCINRGSVVGNGSGSGIGGIVGRIGGALTRCANYGTVTGSGWYMGGIVGSCVSDGASKLTDCYSIGEVRNAHTYAASGTGGLIGYGNYYRAENCFSYGAVSAAAGTVGGVIGKDSGRSTSLRKNLFYLSASCAYAVAGKAEVSGVTALSAEEFASDAFLKQLNQNRCFATENGRYPEFSAACPHDRTERRNALAATCTDAGYSGDLYCSRCGALLEQGHTLPTTACPGARFTDMPAKGNWAHAGIDFCLNNALFDGIGGGRFDPDGKMTRAMLVVVLWRLDGKSKPTSAADFRDVENGTWYTDAVAWAAENSIVNGVGGGRFDPDGNVTREQIATIMYRYADFKRADTAKRASLQAFPDVGEVSSWAYEALSWANAEGLVTGTMENGIDYLAPQQNATRAQVATILMRYIRATEK